MKPDTYIFHILLRIIKTRETMRSQSNASNVVKFDLLRPCLVQWDSKYTFLCLNHVKVF